MKTPLCSALSFALFTASTGAVLAAPSDAGASRPSSTSAEVRMAAPQGADADRARSRSAGTLPAAAGDTGAARTKAITASDVMYSTEEKLGFSTRSYLAKRAPHLSRQAESISHWAGYYRISPKVLIALMEQESGIVGRRRLDLKTALRPFGELSPKSGFNRQVRDVAQRLQAIVLSQREQALSGKAGFVPVDPIQALYAQSGQGKSAAAAGRAPFAGTRFASTYAGLFDETWGAAVKPNILSRVVAKAIPSNTLLQLPYSINQYWRTGYPHSWDGQGTIMSSLDFAPSTSATNDYVRASADGTLIVYSSCFAEIVHSNGWATTYYHLDKIRFPDGAKVYQKDWIAELAETKTQALCDGGSWTGPHLHWTLWKNDVQSSLDGVTVSGYLMKVKSTVNYDTSCSLNELTKNGVTYCFNESIKNNP